ncbi:MAG TPA: hypothetical protein PKA53_02580 [Sphingobacterium sp.]|nr:hypothetical protein [Sphingobacterium sp.]
MARSLKFISYGVLTLFTFSMCGSKSDAKNDSIQLYYDKYNHILLIYNFESARYIKKIELDLMNDTLLIDKVSRKLIPFFRKKNGWLMTECAVKLQPTVEAVKCGDRLFKLSEIEAYSHMELINKRYAVMTVFPKEFPCVIP